MSKIGRKLGRLRALTGSDRLTLARAWLALLYFHLALHLLPFPRVQRLALRSLAGLPPEKQDGTERLVEDMAKLVDIAARNHVQSMSCLRRALALQWLLGRNGVVTDLRIGVRREGETIAAHAWLERGGRPVGQAAVATGEFSVLMPGPATDRR